MMEPETGRLQFPASRHGWTGMEGETEGGTGCGDERCVRGEMPSAETLISLQRQRVGGR